MSLLQLISVFISIIEIVDSLKSCRQQFGSYTYDLNQLSHSTILGNDLSYSYAFTPCGLVSTSKCGNKVPVNETGMTACQFRISTGNFTSSMGYLDGYGKSPNVAFSENSQGPGTGIVMIIRNAVCTGRERFVQFVFNCDRSVTKPTKMEVKETSCNFTITINAAEACPVNGGVSGGLIFLIILLVLVVVYLVGGVLYNRIKNKQTGVALLPHPSFWLLLFAMFTNGCRFTWSFVRTCGRPSQAYQSV